MPSGTGEGRQYAIIGERLSIGAAQTSYQLAFRRSDWKPRIIVGKTLIGDTTALLRE